MQLLAQNLNLAAIFGGMLFFVWVLPGMICRPGKFPEDVPQRKRA
jgi:hypothetical protein